MIKRFLAALPPGFKRAVQHMVLAFVVVVATSQVLLSGPVDRKVIVGVIAAGAVAAVRAVLPSSVVTGASRMAMHAAVAFISAVAGSDAILTGPLDRKAIVGALAMAAVVAFRTLRPPDPYPFV